jgi:SAM-dependent methyltransferase
VIRRTHDRFGHSPLDKEATPSSYMRPMRIMYGDPSKKYGFGKNWRTFLEKNFSEEHLLEAEKSLQSLLEGENPVGKSFMDIGCGSGLFSLAAWRLGVSQVISFDVDEESVGCCRHLANDFHGNDSREWRIFQGSILDPEVVKKVERCDIVYAWGVLHHTGNMWRAIENGGRLVERGGLFVIGIYNWQGGRLGTETWRKLKKWYCLAPRWQTVIWEWMYIGWKLAYMVLVFRNPVAYLRSYKLNRGMSWFRDISDWLGGYPYEAATPGDVLTFGRKRLGFELVKQNVNCGLGVSEFVFRNGQSRRDE